MAFKEIQEIITRFTVDDSEFGQKIKGINKEFNSTKSELKALQEALVLEWDDSKFTRAQQLAQKSLELSKTRVEELKNAMAKLADTDKEGVGYATCKAGDCGGNQYNKQRNSDGHQK